MTFLRISLVAVAAGEGASVTQEFFPKCLNFSCKSHILLFRKCTCQKIDKVRRPIQNRQKIPCAQKAGPGIGRLNRNGSGNRDCWSGSTGLAWSCWAPPSWALLPDSFDWNPLCCPIHNPRHHSPIKSAFNLICNYSICIFCTTSESWNPGFCQQPDYPMFYHSILTSVRYYEKTLMNVLANPNLTYLISCWLPEEYNPRLHQWPVE